MKHGPEVPLPERLVRVSHEFRDSVPVKLEDRLNFVGFVPRLEAVTTPPRAEARGGESRTQDSEVDPNDQPQ
jgi:hypothetical protein